MANHKRRIAELADHTGCPVGSIQDCFDGRVVKNRICTAGFFQFSFNVCTTFFFGVAVNVVVHDDTLTERLMDGKLECII